MVSGFKSLTGESTGRKFAFLTIFDRTAPDTPSSPTSTRSRCSTSTTARMGRTPTTTCRPPTWVPARAQIVHRRRAPRHGVRVQCHRGDVADLPRRPGPVGAVHVRCRSRWHRPGGRRDGAALARDATRTPVPLGASTYNGKIPCFGQDDTYSYFQTGMRMAGTLRSGSVAEAVTGTAGHVDRQWFPRYPGGGGTGGDPRARATSGARYTSTTVST